MKFALLSLYSMVTDSSLPARMLFRRCKGFFGIIHAAVLGASISPRVYFTNLWESVTTKTRLLVENWKYKPLITSRKSLFPQAKLVVLIWVASTSPCTTVEVR